MQISIYHRRRIEKKKTIYCAGLFQPISYTCMQSVFRRPPSISQRRALHTCLALAAKSIGYLSSRHRITVPFFMHNCPSVGRRVVTSLCSNETEETTVKKKVVNDRCHWYARRQVVGAWCSVIAILYCTDVYTACTVHDARTWEQSFLCVYQSVRRRS